MAKFLPGDKGLFEQGNGQIVLALLASNVGLPAAAYVHKIEVVQLVEYSLCLLVYRSGALIIAEVIGKLSQCS